MQTTAGIRYLFSGFRLDPERGELYYAGEEITLRPRSFQVLQYLVERAGRVVTRDELMEALWSPSVVTDGALTQCLVDIRRSLGDPGRDLIRTLPKRGFVLEADVTREPALPGRSRLAPIRAPNIPLGNHLRRWLWPALAVSLVIALAAFWQWRVPGGTDGDAVSLAVLPFADLGTVDQPYLAEALAEDVRTLLASRSEIRVIGQNSAAAAASEPLEIQKIGQKLGVQFVLEGSLRRAADRVLVNVRLISAASGADRWARAYDRPFDDLPALRGEIAAAVANALGVSAPRRDVDIDAGAYSRYVQARHLIHSLVATSGETRVGSTAPGQLLEQALEIEPDFVAAHLEMARYDFVRTRVSRTAEDWGRIESRVLKALAIDPEGAAANAWLGWIASQRHGDRTTALALYQRALAREPANLDAARGLVPILLDLYRFEQAIAFGRFVTQRDPLCAVCFRTLAQAYSVTGRLEEAESALRQALLLAPGAPSSLGVGAEIAIRRGDPARALRYVESFEPDWLSRLWTESVALWEQGRRGAADESFQRLQELWGEEAPQVVAFIHATRGNVEAAFEWLERVDSSDARNVSRPAAYHDSRWPSLVEDPRWHEFQTRLGVAPEQFAELPMDLWPPGGERP